jgi:hypothetical protein
MMRKDGVTGDLVHDLSDADLCFGILPTRHGVTKGDVMTDLDAREEALGCYEHQNDDEMEAQVDLGFE